MPPRGARADGNEQARGGTAPFVAESNGAENGAGPRRASELLLQNSAIRVLGYCRVFKPPAGGAGGSELSDGPTRAPKREGRGRTARAGGGWGRGLFGVLSSLGFIASPVYDYVLLMVSESALERKHMSKKAP